MGGGLSKTALDGDHVHWSVQVTVGAERRVFSCSDSSEHLVNKMLAIVSAMHDEVTVSAPDKEGNEFPVKVAIVFSKGYTNELVSVLGTGAWDVFGLNGLPIIRPLVIDMSIYMEKDHMEAAKQLGGIGERLVQKASDLGIRANVRYVSNNGT